MDLSPRVTTRCWSSSLNSGGSFVRPVSLRAGVVPRLVVPPLSEALGTLVADRREYLGSLPTTFGEIAVSYVIVCGGGILAGQLIGASAAARRMLLPVLRSAYASCP